METYIEDKKNIYSSILKFLEESDEPDNDELKQKSFQKLIDDISRHFAGDREEKLQFLETINSEVPHLYGKIRKKVEKYDSAFKYFKGSKSIKL